MVRDARQGQAEPKRLNEMNRLGDMGSFPVPVYCGATANVLLTIAVTWWLEPRLRTPFHLLFWIALVLFVNLLPVVVLRSATLGPGAEYRPVAQMRFFADQHRFSDWVYLAASANMTFWILLAWAVFSVERSGRFLAMMLLVALVATFFPAWVRLFVQGRGRR